MQKFLLIDPDQCTGCRDCELVCPLEHDDVINPYRSRITIISEEWKGMDFPIVCQQCEEPVCQKVCPVNAISEDTDTGAKVIHQNKCIQCRVCMMNCPLGGVGVDPVTADAIKCDLCGGNPQCVEVCETNTLRFVEATKANLEKKRKSLTKYLEWLERTETREV
ncbi:electron transporter [candidate division MSBL1 archaeon SCGC-AAA259I09]|uniref:Electron transporter n=1 Tax=candidate division MSBL1 archaeon SCGC-AAA259I09 TaxID=1698267 RepID=A0A133UP16_9EURY|nr:electron transporter [candidate division MSBL1 archaeon SCGC-AAA259I09]